jgi:hypothetical protein
MTAMNRSDRQAAQRWPYDNDSTVLEQTPGRWEVTTATPLGRVSRTVEGTENQAHRALSRLRRDLVEQEILIEAGQGIVADYDAHAARLREEIRGLKTQIQALTLDLRCRTSELYGRDLVLAEIKKLRSDLAAAANGRVQ